MENRREKRTEHCIIHIQEKKKERKSKTPKTGGLFKIRANEAVTAFF